MILRGLARRDLVELERALRVQESCTLVLDEGFPRGVRADQFLPLVDAVKTRTRSEQEALEFLLPPRRSGAKGTVCAIIPSNRGTPAGLHALRAQDVELEVLVMANGEMPAEGDRVLRVHWEGHGATRQRGVEACDADYVLFSVDDAIPRGEGCVGAMINALEEGGYDAVFARQVAWPLADPVTRDRISRWTPPGREHHRVERHDHVFALYRRATLLENPLPEVPIGEDLHWRQGRRIGYVPTAPVLHSHKRRPRALYRRTRDLHVEHLRVGEEPAIPTLGALIGALPGILRPVLSAGAQELPNQLAELAGQLRAAQIDRRQGRSKVRTQPKP